ncbi:hypothetical protein DFJ73DRAFT_639746 [Zopfochytrium polystomum]|nr:hypothetical protein DFJ73DRAFT_639746 [Zopfochytrium polystomum]
MAWQPLPAGSWHGLAVCSFLPSTITAALAAGAAVASTPAAASSSLPPFSPAQSAATTTTTTTSTSGNTPVAPPSVTAAVSASASPAVTARVATAALPTSSSFAPQTQTSPSTAIAIGIVEENLAPLEVGDNVHILEEYVPSADDVPSTDPFAPLFSSSKTRWYRGYVYQTSNPRAPPKIGVFPATHVYCPDLVSHRQAQSQSPLRSLDRPPLADSGAMGLQRGPTLVHAPSDPSSPAKRSRPSSFISPTGKTGSGNLVGPPLPAPVAPTRDTIGGSREPLVDEISAALREWGVLLKQHLVNQDYPRFAVVKDLFHELFQGRRQLLSQTLSPDEVVKLRRSLVVKLDYGNRIQKLDLIVRHPDRGHLVGERNSSVVKMFRNHLEVAFKWSAAGKPGFFPPPASSAAQLTFMSGQSSNSMSKERVDASDVPKSFCLYFELTACTASICLPGEYAELAFFLFNRQESRIISEDFLIIIDYNGNPRPADDGQARLSTIFCDLAARDFNEHAFLVCRIVRVGKMNVSDKENVIGTKGANSVGNSMNSLSSGEMSPGYRRPFGCAVVELQEVWNTALQLSGTSAAPDFMGTKELSMKLHVPAPESNFPIMHELIMNRLAGFETSARADLLKVLLCVAAQPPPSAPMPFPASERTPKMGFPDVVIPAETRNSLYLTLISGEFSARATALSARNVQVTCQVRLQDGSYIENYTNRGLSSPESQYESIVYYHNNTPRYMEPFCITLDPHVLENAHIFFTFRHCSSTDKNDRSPFAFGYLPLFRMDQTVIHDGQHTLTLYKYDKKILHPSIYLSYQAGPNIPPSASSSQSAESLYAAADAMSKAPQLRDIMIVKTQLCSTIMTQSSAVLSLLNWKRTVVQSRTPIETILRNFFLVPEIEVVKFLHGVLDSLFEIMDSPDLNVKNKLDDQLFNALVYALSVVVDRRFIPFGTVVDIYVDKWFKSLTCWRNLSSSFLKLLDDPTRKETRDAIKVWGYWIRFIVRSGLAEQRTARLSNQALTPMGPSFMELMSDLLQGIERVMANMQPEAIAAQTLALQYFPQLLPDLARVYGPAELVSVVVRFADSVRGSKARLNAHKLAFMYTLIRGPLFADRRSRFGLVSAITRWIAECISGEWDRDRESGPTSPLSPTSARASFRENDNLRLCLNVTVELIDRLQKVGDRLERGKGDKAGAGAGGVRDASDAASREEDFRKCVDKVSELLPRLLETYTDCVETLPKPTPAARYSKISVSSNGSSPSIRPSTSTYVTMYEQTDYQSHSASGPYFPTTIALTELGAALISLVHLLPEPNLRAICSRPVTKGSLIGHEYSGSQIITFLFITFQSLLRGDAFPASWIASHTIVTKMVVKSLRAISFVLQRESTDDTTPIAPPRRDSMNGSQQGSSETTQSATAIASARRPSNMEIKNAQIQWADYFRILLQLLNSRWVGIETFNPQRARVATRLGGDVRGEAGELLRSMWEYLTESERAGRGVQMAFIPNLFGPFLELTMSPHPGLKSAAVELMFSTIEREYRAQDNFRRIESECFDRLDRLIADEGHGDDAYRRFFIEALGRRFTDAAKAVAAGGLTETAPGTPGTIGIRPSIAGGGSVAAATAFAAFGARFLGLLDTYLELCISLRDIPPGERFDEERLWFALKLIRFLREAGRKRLYARYVHLLAGLHVQAENFVEAALALKLYADLLPWSHALQLAPAPHFGFPHWQTCFERKEQSYLTCIDYLERADHWERALMMNSELAVQYERGWYDYAKYAHTLARSAKLVESILEKERYHPSYFRVGFYGRGFPLTLRNKQFVYRGGEWEKIGPFCERILNKYVGAQLLRTNAPPGDDILNGAGRWIQITAVNPEIDSRKWGSDRMTGAWLNWEPPLDNTDSGFVSQYLNPSTSSSRRNSQTYRSSDSVAGLTTGDYSVEPELDPNFEGLFSRAAATLDRVPEAVKNYYLYNEINMFSFSRPFKRAPVPPVAKDDPAREFLELWTEKTLLITADSFPCLSKRSEVARAFIQELSPIENAVIAIRTKNRQLREFERKYEPLASGVAPTSSSSSYSGQSTKRGSGAIGRNVNLFTMALNGAVDAPVNGGIPMYRRAFLSETYRRAHPKDGVLVDSLEKAINEQAEIIYRCISIHDAVVPMQMRPLHEALVASFHKNFASEISRLGLTKAGRVSTGSRSKFSSRDWASTEPASYFAESEMSEIHDIYQFNLPNGPSHASLLVSTGSPALPAYAPLSPLDGMATLARPTLASSTRSNRDSAHLGPLSLNPLLNFGGSGAGGLGTPVLSSSAMSTPAMSAGDTPQTQQQNMYSTSSAASVSSGGGTNPRRLSQASMASGRDDGITKLFQNW